MVHNLHMLLYENILDNMRDGVISVDLDGLIMTFNDAAGHILSPPDNDIVNQNFSKLFFMDPRNDEFSDIILESIYKSNITQKAIVKYYHHEKVKYLQVSTTFLFTPPPESIKYGVVIIFSDVTANFAMDRMKELFGKYIDPRIATHLLEPDREIEMINSRQGFKQIMTVSFCDMQNFTGISDSLSAPELVNLINAFFNKMCKPVHDYQGIIDKYIGDEIMSFWGHPFVQSNHAELACNAALGQIRSLVSLNKELGGKLPEILINTGIATGELIAGNVGSEQSKNFTAMGTTVSVASRLVDFNKLYGTHILATEETVKMVKDNFEFREVDKILAYINQKTPIYIYELLGKKEKVATSLLKAREHYQEGLQLYRKQYWREAREMFVASLANRPYDKAAVVLMSRMEHYTLYPPGKDWDGVWRANR